MEPQQALNQNLLVSLLRSVSGCRKSSEPSSDNSFFFLISFSQTDTLHKQLGHHFPSGVTIKANTVDSPSSPLQPYKTVALHLWRLLEIGSWITWARTCVLSLLPCITYIHKYILAISVVRFFKSGVLLMIHEVGRKGKGGISLIYAAIS